MKGHRTAPGFTLIELVVTLVLVGSLAVTALPRFLDLSDDANQAVFEAVRGSFGSGIQLAHAKARSVAARSAMPASVTMGGVTVDVTANGWPAVSQTASNCTAALRGSGGTTRLARGGLPGYVLPLLGVGTAHAGGGGGGGGSCSLLELVITGELTDTWTTSVSGTTATFTDPEGRSFTYDETDGSVT